jgi:hypothetical protein
MTRPRRNRRRDNEDEEVTFGDITPWKNPAAVYGYRCAVVGLTPVLGILTGPVAIVLGILGIRKHRMDHANRGYAQSRAAVILGLIEFMCNAGGLALLGRGLGWWG